MTNLTDKQSALVNSILRAVTERDDRAKELASYVNRWQRQAEYWHRAWTGVAGLLLVHFAVDLILIAWWWNH